MDKDCISKAQQEKLEKVVGALLNRIDTDTMDQECSIKYLLTGQDSRGTEFYAYMVLKPGKYQEFIEKTALKQPVIPTDYGIIIHKGVGTTPPIEIQEKMHKEFGFNPDYQKKHAEMIVEQWQKQNQI